MVCRRSSRYRCGDISLERDIGEISQGSSDISLNYRSNVLLICAIYRRDIGEISEEQSAIFDDYRYHYFCTILLHPLSGDWGKLCGGHFVYLYSFGNPTYCSEVRFSLSEVETNNEKYNKANPLSI